MRRHAKAPDAGSTSGRGSRSGSVRRVFATRGVSGAAHWSGAPSRALILVAAFALALILAPQAFAAKKVSSWFPLDNVSGTTGDRFNTPRDVAVNYTGNGGVSTGTIYVADTNNNRVSRFSASGVFQRAWGVDVVDGVASPGAAGDTGTGAAARFEICTVASQCKAGIAGSGNAADNFRNGQLNSPTGVAVDQDTGNVYVADRNNNRLNEYDADGTFIRSWGGDVDATVADTGYEICPAADICKVGTTGTAVGQWGPGNPQWRLDVSPPDGNPATGMVIAADPGNSSTTGKRLLHFDLDGQNPAAIGSPAGGQFPSTGNPLYVAVDSRGIVYATNGSTTVVRYNTSGPTPGFLPNITNVAGGGPLVGSSTTGLEVDPDSDGLGAADRDLLYVSRGTAGVQELDVAVEPVSTTALYLEGSGISPLSIAFNPVSPSKLLLSATNRVFVADDVGATGAPTVTFLPVTNLAAHGFTLNAEINPQGFPTTYRFQYSSDGVSWTNVTADQSVGEGLASVAIDDDVSGLQANFPYQYRVLVTRGFGNGQTTVPGGTVTTALAPPEVLPLTASKVTAESAILNAGVNPQNSATTYRFEYGSQGPCDANPCTSVPVLADPALSAGSGGTPVTVSRKIEGLQPATVYHFRLVASNAAGSTLGLSRTFLTRNSENPPPDLPDDRGYEMVSPLEKNGSDIYNDSDFGLTQASADGSTLAYRTHVASAFAGAGGSFDNQYLARRDAEGWTTEGLNPPVDVSPVSGAGVIFQWFSGDLSKAVFKVNGRVGTNAPGPVNDFIRDNDTGTYSLLTDSLVPFTDDAHLNPALQDVAEIGVFAGASDDGRHVFFGDKRRLTPDAPPESSTQRNVYEWVEGSPPTLRLASVLPGAAGAAAGRTFVGGRYGVGNEQGFPGEGAVSADGTKVFFTVAAPSTSSTTGSLYLRDSGASTVEISASEGPGASGDATFLAANPTATVALFSSASKLTPASVATASKPDLYLWDASAPVGSRLTDLTTGDPGGAGVLGIAGSSTDLGSVYFVATGVLAPGATAAQPNLYLWRKGESIGFLGTLDGTLVNGSAADAGVWSTLTGRGSDFKTFGLFRNYRQARVTPDGQSLLFLSQARLTDYDNSGRRQVYLYDVSTGDVSCVSCNPQAPSSTAGAQLFSYKDGTVQEVSTHLPRNLSPDGSRAFFESSEALVTGDTNGTVDVYEWQRNGTGSCEDESQNGGCLSLISSGQSANPSRFMDASVSGNDAFFTTAQRLDPYRDLDDAYDAYDARVGGGFPPPPALPPCEGDACLSAVVVPDDPTPASSSFSGAGNQAPARKGCAKGKVRKGGKCVKHKGKTGKGKSKRANHNGRAGR